MLSLLTLSKSSSVLLFAVGIDGVIDGDVVDAILVVVIVVVVVVDGAVVVLPQSGNCVPSPILMKALSCNLS